MPARLQVLLAAICFGTTGTAQAIGPGGSPVAVGAARIVFGGLLLVLVARGLRVRLPRIGAGLVGMACAVAVYQLSFFAAVRLTGVAVGTVVAIGTGPAAAGVLGRLVNGERLSARWAQATALAAFGVLLLAGDGGASVDPTGVALAVTSGVGYATYTVLSKRMLDAGEAPEGVMAAGFGGAGLLLAAGAARRRPRLPGDARRAGDGGLPGRRPHRAGLRALLARAAPSVERRDGDDRPRRAAHRRGARGHRARRAPVARGRRRRAARARRPARPRGARAPAARAGGGAGVNATALRRASTVDQLTAVLRERILAGDLEPGQRLIERELVEAYEVARHTLRAALRQLEVEGLVRVEPNRGARVAELSGDELTELFELRLALEREAAHLALERGDGRLPAARARGGAAPAAPRAATALDLERDLARPRTPSTRASSRRDVPRASSAPTPP